MNAALRAIPAAALLLAGCATSKPAPAAKAEAVTQPAPAAEPAKAAEAPKPAPPAKPARPGLNVDLDRPIAPVNRAVLGGYNFGNWMPVVDFLEDLQAVKPAELRFPGGNVGDENDLTDASLANFQSNLKMLGNPPAVIQTRVFQGGISKDPPKNGPEDAAEDVRMAKARGINVRYWEIGNEPDLFSRTRGDPSWTPAKYCQVFRAQAAAMKAVDPSVKVAGPAVSGAKPIRDNFIAGFVKECGDVVDVLTWHIYPTDGQMTDELALSTVSEADETIDGLRALWADPQANPKGHQRKIQMGITEYGLSWFTTRFHHLTDVPAAMWASEMALRFAEKGLDSAHYFAFAVTGGHGLVDQAGVRRPTYFAFTMLNKLSGDLVPATTGDADVWSHAARSGTRLDVILTNTATAAKTLPVEVPGFTLRYGVFFDEAIVKDERPVSRLTIEPGPGPTVTLPPRSMVHLVFGQGDAAVVDDYPAKAEAAPAPAEPTKGKPAPAAKPKAKKAAAGSTSGLLPRKSP
jgi:hypothetical protein